MYLRTCRGEPALQEWRASGMGESRPGRAQGPAPFVFQDRTEMVNLVRAQVIRSAHRVGSKGPYLTLRKYEAIIWDFFFSFK